MGLSDRNECVRVELIIDDWATVITALATSDAPLADKERINSVIFACARGTARSLS